MGSGEATERAIIRRDRRTSPMMFGRQRAKKELSKRQVGATARAMTLGSLRPAQGTAPSHPLTLILAALLLFFTLITTLRTSLIRCLFFCPITNRNASLRFHQTGSVDRLSRLGHAGSSESRIRERLSRYPR